MSRVIVGVSLLLGLALTASACTGSSDSVDNEAQADEATTSTSTAEGAGELSVDDADREVDPDETDNQAVTGVLEWEPCGSIECATFTVPLDHDQPDGTTIDLAVYRYATDAEDRLGSLFVNYGGPGAESGDIFQFDAAGLAGALTDRFDLITWDPRGIGQSSRLECEVLVEDAGLLEPVDIDDGVDDEVTEFVEYFDALNRCSGESPVLDHLSTTDTARDLDLLRAAVGDEQLTFLGFSYGTQLGWVYATLYPDRVRAMVLDGALPDDYFDDLGWPAEQLAAFERSFQHLVDVCDRESSCSAREEGLGNRVERIAAELAADPIDLADGSQWGEVEFRAAVLSTLYLDPPTVGAAIDDYLRAIDEDRDPSLLIEFADQGADTSTPGSFEAVTCADGAVGPTDDAEVEQVLSANLEASPTFGATPFYLPCDQWQGEVTPLPDLNTEGTPTLLVVGNTLDPSTPYEDAVLLDRQLADSALLTYAGAGHTIVGFHACVDDAVRSYFEDLVVPIDVRCESAARYGILITERDGAIEVEGIEPGSAAALASIQIGDRIIAVDGSPVPTLQDLPAPQPDVTTVFTIERDGNTLELDVTPERLPWS